MSRSRAYSIVCTAAICVPGCISPAQQEWHWRVGLAYDAVNEITRSGADLLSCSQFAAVFGKPDYSLMPAELRQCLASSDAYREHVMDHLFADYSEWAVRSESYRTNWANGGVGLSERFDMCRLWFYDESRHFARPLPAWGWDPGFSCYIFIVEDERVVEARTFPRWPRDVSGVGR
jgi:hypothetical protein